MRSRGFRGSLFNMSTELRYTNGRKRTFVDANPGYRLAPPSGALSTVVVAAPSTALRVGDTAILPDGSSDGVAEMDGDVVTMEFGETRDRGELEGLGPPDAGSAVFVRYPSISPAVWMGRNLPVICRSDTPGAVYVGVMHSRQCTQYYRNARTLLVQVLGQVTLQLTYKGGEWVPPVYKHASGATWKIGEISHPSGGIRLHPPGRVNWQRGAGPGA